MPARRSGKTLIELMFVIVVIGMVMTVCAKTMVVVINRERSGRESYQANSDRHRLAGDFRNDVNAAKASILRGQDGTPGQELLLELPQQRVVRYRIEGDTITRAERLPQAEFARRESYYLGHSAAEFEIEPGDPDLILLAAAISNQPGTSASTERHFRVEAARGRDLRFLPGGTP